MASCYIKDILSQFSLLCTYAKGFIDRFFIVKRNTAHASRIIFGVFFLILPHYNLRKRVIIDMTMTKEGFIGSLIA